MMPPSGRPERRHAPRYRFIAGASFVASGQTYTCVLVNLSPLGARLHLLAPMELPETVRLHLPAGIVRAAHRRWQIGAEVGMAFAESLAEAEARTIGLVS